VIYDRFESHLHLSKFALDSIGKQNPQVRQELQNGLESLLKVINSDEVKNLPAANSTGDFFIGETASVRTRVDQAIGVDSAIPPSDTALLNLASDNARLLALLRNKSDGKKLSPLPFGIILNEDLLARGLHVTNIARMAEENIARNFKRFGVEMVGVSTESLSWMAALELFRTDWSHARILIEGPKGTGKRTIAKNIAKRLEDYRFRMLTEEDMGGASSWLHNCQEFVSGSSGGPCIFEVPANFGGDGFKSIVNAAQSLSAPIIGILDSSQEELTSSKDFTTVRISPLKRSMLEIVYLLGLFAKQAKNALGQPIDIVDVNAIHQALLYDWPGNVEELRKVVFQSAQVTSEAVIRNFIIDSTTKFE
jgi:hypothetical protein